MHLRYLFIAVRLTWTHRKRGQNCHCEDFM